MPIPTKYVFCNGTVSNQCFKKAASVFVYNLQEFDPKLFAKIRNVGNLRTPY